MLQVECAQSGEIIGKFRRSIFQVVFGLRPGGRIVGIVEWVHPFRLRGPLRCEALKLPGPLGGRGCVFDQSDQEFGAGYIALEGEFEEFICDLLALFMVLRAALRSFLRGSAFPRLRGSVICRIFPAPRVPQFYSFTASFERSKECSPISLIGKTLAFSRR